MPANSVLTILDEGTMEVWKAALDCIASNFEITWPNIDENTVYCITFILNCM